MNSIPVALPYFVQKPLTISCLLMTTAASLILERKPVLDSMLLTWALTVSAVTPRASAICQQVMLSAKSRRTRSSASENS